MVGRRQARRERVGRLGQFAFHVCHRSHAMLTFPGGLVELSYLRPPAMRERHRHMAMMLEAAMVATRVMLTVVLAMAAAAQG